MDHTPGIPHPEEIEETLQRIARSYRLRWLCQKVRLNASELEEAFDHARLKALDALQRLFDASRACSWQAYLTRILESCIWDQVRQRKHQPDSLTLPNGRVMDPSDRGRQVKRQEARLFLEQILAKAPARIRDIASLLVQGHTLAQTAEHLGMTMSQLTHLWYPWCYEMRRRYPDIDLR